MPFRTLIKKGILAAGILLATLVVLEIGVRFSGFAARHISDPIYMPFAGSADIPYIHKPNLRQARGRGLTVVDTDSLGLRSTTVGQPHASKKAGEFRIAIFGDSVTFGEGVTKTEDTFAQVLQDLLNQRSPGTAFKVFNFGVSAYSVREMVATLRYRAIDIDPDLVVMAIIPNDFELGRTPGVDSSGYLISQKLSRFAPGNPKVRDTLRRIHLAYLIRGLGERWIPKPNPDIEVLGQGRVPASYQYVDAFRNLAEDRGIAYVIVLLPSPWWPWGEVPGQLARDSISSVDLRFLLDEIAPGQFAARRFDPHPSPVVHRRIAEELAVFVLRTQQINPVKQ